MNQFISATSRCISRRSLDVPRSRLCSINHSVSQSLSLLSLLRGLREPKAIQQLHARILVAGLSDGTFLSNTLLRSYICYVSVSEADNLFSAIPNKNVFSWTIYVSGLVENGLAAKAVGAFREMLAAGFDPNEVSIASVLPAFGASGSAKIGKSGHGYWIRRGFENNVVVETALVDMYCKLGFLSVARILFDYMPHRNAVSWNVIISGCSDNRFGKEAFRLFGLMRREEFCLDMYTIMSMISASSCVDCLSVESAMHGFVIKTGERHRCLDIDAYKLFKLLGMEQGN